MRSAPQAAKTFVPGPYKVPVKIWHLFFELRCTPAVTRCREKANKCGVTVNSRERKMTHLWLCRQIASPTLRMDTYPATCWVSTVVCEAYPAEPTHIRYCCLVVGAPSCPRCTEVHSGVCSLDCHCAFADLETRLCVMTFFLNCNTFRARLRSHPARLIQHHLLLTKPTMFPCAGGPPQSAGPLYGAMMAAAPGLATLLPMAATALR